MANPTKTERVQAILEPMMKTAFFFERPDGSRGVTIKSSPRRKGFTVNLDDLTAQEAEDIGAAVTEALKTAIHPDAQEWVESRVKKWDGKRKGK